MNTQDNLNLAVEYLEVVTCTYKELCAIKKPANGRLYHTSDTNEFYFDWKNKRHKLSVFPSESNSGDVVKKSELSNWLKENNYITNLSLADELVKVIGTPIKNIITKKALDNYSKNYLLTKEELNLLNEPLNLVEDVKNLQNTDKTLYSYCDKLSTQINKVRTEASNKISSGELNTKLNDYLKKSLAESIYITKDDANNLFIDEEEFAEKIKGYVTKDEADSSYVKKEDLSEFESKSEIGDKLSTFATKMWVDEYYNRKEDLKRELNKYATKDYLFEQLSEYAKNESVDEKIEQTINKIVEVNNKLGKFATKEQVRDIAEKIFPKDEILSTYATKEELEEKLSEYMKESKLYEISDCYTTEDYVDDKVRGLKDSVREIGESVEDHMSLVQKQLDNMNHNFDTFSKKMWVDENYMKKFKLSDYMKTDDIYDIFIEKNVVEDTYLKKLDAEKTYAKITDLIGKTTGDFITRLEAQSFAKKMWVDEYYMRKGQLEGIKNAMVLSTEFGTENEMREFGRTIQSGFYYLTNDEELFLAVDDGTGTGDKIFVNITNLHTDAVLFFGGDTVDW